MIYEIFGTLRADPDQPIDMAGLMEELRTLLAAHRIEAVVDVTNMRSTDRVRLQILESHYDGRAGAVGTIEVRPDARA